MAALNQDYNDYLLKQGGTPSRAGYYTIGHKELNRTVISLEEEEVKRVLENADFFD
ncbi:MAG: hypothetical protein ABEI54_03985 [Candidatus Bipolaricaulia bacterium]